MAHFLAQQLAIGLCRARLAAATAGNGLRNGLVGLRGGERAVAALQFQVELAVVGVGVDGRRGVAGRELAGRRGRGEEAGTWRALLQVLWLELFRIIEKLVL